MYGPVGLCKVFNDNVPLKLFSGSATKLKVAGYIWLYVSLLRALGCYQGDEGLSVGQYQLSCMPKMHCYLSRTR